MARRLEALPEIADIDLSKELFNEVYFPHLRTIHNYELYYGGNGSGKSSFIGQKLALQMTLFENRNLICVRKQKADCVKSCWGEIYTSLKRFHLLKYWKIQKNPDHLMTNRINGNHILFEGMDNVEDIKSIKFAKETDDDDDKGTNVTDVWYEEVSAEDIENNVEELDDRVRDPYVKGRLILSFNPVSRTHWLYRYVTVNMEQEGVDKVILKTTYKDNKFLPKSQGEKLERHKFTNPYRYQVYCLGNWGSVGETVFDANKIQKRLDELSVYFQDNPYIEGQFDYEADSKGIPIENTIKFFESKKGKTTIFFKPDPKTPYVVSLDTAGEGKDFHVAYVVDNITKIMCAKYRFDGAVDSYVWQVYGLCKMYNNALFAPEINLSMWPITAFQMLGYSNLYRRETSADQTHRTKERKYGFRTTSGNRQTILTEMVQWTNAQMETIYDIDLLNEMLLFTVQEKKLHGIFWGAEPGAHDDCVMAYAIILQAFSQQHCTIQPERVPLEGAWLRIELESAVEEGRVDRRAALEYIKSKGVAFESADTKYKPKIKIGGSRYARR
jgi:phage terminase large subunit